MCSVIIARRDGQTMITMNRDERRDRATETPPFTWQNGMLAPRDEAAGGTWVGVMPNGAWACLLNSYEAVEDNPHVLSRGNIIPSILDTDNPEQALHTLQKNFYRPFRLLMGDRSNVFSLSHWDGLSFYQRAIVSLPFFASSSSWNTTEVLKTRDAAFDLWCQCGMPHDEFGRPMLNRWREANAAHTGILMQRPESHTTSLTQIRLDAAHNTEMRYWREADLLSVPQKSFFDTTMTADNRVSL